nr:hypothetical protein [Tanacetum cinerariifolium]
MCKCNCKGTCRDDGHRL